MDAACRVAEFGAVIPVVGGRCWLEEFDPPVVCEHLALSVLGEGGIPAARTRLFEGGGRVLLEVERFDRTPQGRIGMVSLLAFDAEHIGQMDNWGISEGFRALAERHAQSLAARRGPPLRGVDEPAFVRERPS